MPVQREYSTWSRASVKAHMTLRELEQLLPATQVCRIAATGGGVEAEMSEPTRFLDYSNIPRSVFPAFPPLISQGLIKLWGFFSLGAAKCQKLIMRFMSHPHYNYTRMKHCKPLKDQQLTLGLPTPFHARRGHSCWWIENTNSNHRECNKMIRGHFFVDWNSCTWLEL